MTNSKKDPVLSDLINFFQQSPTAWHVTAEVKKKLKHAGFIELKEKNQWNLELGKSYFVTRNDSSFCAFTLPIQIPKRTRLLATHTDSPSLKLKPNTEIRKQNMVLFGVEVYGAPLLSSWLNRDLGIAGRVVYRNLDHLLVSQLVRLEDHPLVIPQLAIHLDREVNEKGLLLNKQEHLNAFAALIDDSWPSSENYLEYLLRQKISFNQILNFDLFLYPLEGVKFCGYNNQMISGYRIDNLASLHATLYSFLNDLTPAKDDIKMIISWDNEEIGSQTLQGAGSAYLAQILERITLAMQQTREDYFKLLNQSLCISLDMAHALHPNYIDKHDAQHQVLLGKGVAVKSNAQGRYATDAYSSIAIQEIANQEKVKLQRFVSRNDIPCGTTIGPIQATLCGMPTIDLGCAQLSMHSARELMSCQDHLEMCHLLHNFLNNERLQVMEF